MNKTNLSNLRTCPSMQFVERHMRTISLRGPVCLRRSFSRQARRLVSASSQPVQEVSGQDVVSLPLQSFQVEAGLELDSYGVSRLALREGGWNTWNWRDYKVNYIQAGTSGPPVVLVHGFGASGYHWRYNIPELAKTCRVFAIDLLGFGWSDKPLVEYNGYGVWGDQLAAFLTEVVGEPAVLVGNSLGGYSSLLCAARNPKLVNGLVLLNAAGRFEDVKASVAAPSQAALTPAEKSLISRMVVDPLTTMAKRAAVYLTFIATKQPARIRSVLQQVYYDDRNVDDDLVRSIVLPAENPNASEVFYRVISATGSSVNSLLGELQVPLMLLWGDKDPWIGPASADKIMALYPSATRVRLTAGHCPHDDAPGLVNEALLKWVGEL